MTAGAGPTAVTLSGAGDGGWEAVIGLEIHVQLKTVTKMFCGCTLSFGDEPNTHVCPVCLGHPGSLPVTNERAVEYATRIALALDCRVADHTVFHRKNYFYPDLPKGYQISQYDLPIGIGGHLQVELDDGSLHRVGITRAHMEEDAGKLIHAGGTAGRIQGAEYSLVDFNRGGTPLVEIVSEPDIRTPEQARSFLTQLKNLLAHLDVSDVNMEEGSLRCDANVSVRRPGEPLGVKTELKNVNSFRYVQRGLEAEIERQIGVLEAGGIIHQETVHFDPAAGTITSLRSKEEAHDYRYFPEPDLVPIVLDAAYVAAVRASLPELPAARKQRLTREYGLAASDAGILAANRALGDYYEQVVAAPADAKLAAAWVLGDFSGYLNAGNLEVDASRVGPVALAGLLALIKDGTLSGKMAKEVFEAMIASGRPARDVVAERGLGQISDSGELERVIDAIIVASPAAVEEFRAGKERILGYFVGQVMKETRGQANPQLVNDLLRARLQRAERRA